MKIRTARGAKKKKELRKFKLLSGKHYDKIDTGERDGNGNPIYERVTYEAGDVFESSADLEAKFNRPGSIKFERIGAPKEDAEEETHEKKHRSRR